MAEHELSDEALQPGLWSGLSAEERERAAAMRLPPGVARILAPNPSLMTGPGTNTFVVAGTGTAVAIDPGPDDAGHLRRVAEAGAAHGGLSAILLTHGHADHLAGAAGLRALTGAPVLAWGRDGSPAESVADRALADDEVVDVGGRALRALHTPGHRYDHLCFWLGDVRALFAGDLVAGTGTVVIIPPEGDLLDYMASLRRVRALDPAILLPAHGPSIDTPAALLDGYIAHREQREAQVLGALAAPPPDGDPHTIPALVANIYRDVDPALHGMAGRQVLAHLLKLEREGRVRRVGADGWEIAA